MTYFISPWSNKFDFDSLQIRNFKLFVNDKFDNYVQLKPLPKLGTAADDFDSWALTAGILLNKVLFFSNKRTRL